MFEIVKYRDEDSIYLVKDFINAIFSENIELFFLTGLLKFGVPECDNLYCLHKVQNCCSDCIRTTILELSERSVMVKLIKLSVINENNIEEDLSYVSLFQGIPIVETTFLSTTFLKFLECLLTTNNFTHTRHMFYKKFSVYESCSVDDIMNGSSLAKAVRTLRIIKTFIESHIFSSDINGQLTRIYSVLMTDQIQKKIKPFLTTGNLYENLCSSISKTYCKNSTDSIFSKLKEDLINQITFD